MAGVEGRALGWKGDAGNSVVSDSAACAKFLLWPGLWLRSSASWLVLGCVPFPSSAWLHRRVPSPGGAAGSAGCELKPWSARCAELHSPAGVLHQGRHLRGVLSGVILCPICFDVFLVAGRITERGLSDVESGGLLI